MFKRCSKCQVPFVSWLDPNCPACDEAARYCKPYSRRCRHRRLIDFLFNRSYAIVNRLPASSRLQFGLPIDNACTLGQAIDNASTPAYDWNDPYRMVTIECHSCHSWLVLQKQELDDAQFEMTCHCGIRFIPYRPRKSDYDKLPRGFCGSCGAAPLICLIADLNNPRCGCGGTVDIH